MQSNLRGSRWHGAVSKEAGGSLSVGQCLPPGFPGGRQPIQLQRSIIALSGLGSRICRGCRFRRLRTQQVPPERTSPYSPPAQTHR